MSGSCPIETKCTCFNGDVSGPGVRASFYVQSVSLVLLNTRGISKPNEVADALATLITTNLAYCGITFYQGFGLKGDTERLSFYDALMVVYCLSISSTCVNLITFKYTHFKRHHPGLLLLAIVQCYAVGALNLAILWSTPTWPCHEEWHIVIFKRLSPTGGARIFGLFYTVNLLTGFPVVLLLFVVIPDFLSTRYPAFRLPERISVCLDAARLPDFFPPLARILANHGTSRPSPPGELEDSLPRSWIKPMFNLNIITGTIVAVLVVLNTELLRHLNGVPDAGSWGFGQLLALALAGQPAWRVITTFYEQVKRRGLHFRPRPRPHPSEAAEDHAGVELAPVLESGLSERRTQLGEVDSETELVLAEAGRGDRPLRASSETVLVVEYSGPARTAARTDSWDAPTRPTRAHTDAREPNGGRCVTRAGGRTAEADGAGDSFALHSVDSVEKVDTF